GRGGGAGGLLDDDRADAERQGVLVVVPDLEEALGRVEVGGAEHRALVERHAGERVAAGVGVVLRTVAERRLHLRRAGVAAGVVRAAAAHGPGADVRLERLGGPGLVTVGVGTELGVHRLDADGVVVGAEVLVYGG